MAETHIYKANRMTIKIKDLENGGSMETQTAEANILFAILEELRAMNHTIERNRKL